MTNHQNGGDQGLGQVPCGACQGHDRIAGQQGLGPHVVQSLQGNTKLAWTLAPWNSLVTGTPVSFGQFTSYVLSFLLLLAAAVLSKGLLLFMTSQLKPNITHPYCPYGESRPFVRPGECASENRQQQQLYRQITVPANRWRLRSAHQNAWPGSGRWSSVLSCPSSSCGSDRRASACSASGRRRPRRTSSLSSSSTRCTSPDWSPSSSPPCPSSR